MTGREALDMLSMVGFIIDRETDRIFVKRGAMRFTLPGRDEQCNPTLERTVRGVVSDIQERQRRQGLYKPPTIPIMLSYRDIIYAVVADNGDRWQLQNLETGNRFYVRKNETREVSTEQEKEVPPVPELNIVDTPPPPPQEASLLVGLPSVPGFNPELIRLTRHRISELQVIHEQIMNRAKLIEDAIASSELFLESLGVKVEAPTVRIEPKRTILPPVTGPRGRGGRAIFGLPEAIKSAWEATNGGSTRQIQVILKEKGFDVSDSTVYNHITKLKGA